MEFESIIVAIITGVCAVAGQYLIARENKRKADVERAVRDAHTEEILQRLEAKVDEHNGYAKRFEEVSVALAELRTELKMKG